VILIRIAVSSSMCAPDKMVNPQLPDSTHGFERENRPNPRCYL
jgi:hypothetical protein